MSHTVDDSTKASNPGQLSISKSKYLDYVGLNGLQRSLYSFLFCFSSDFLIKYFRSNNVVYDYISKQEQFRLGCINPCIVINVQKGIIATFTNLTSIGDDPTPVVKISKEPLHLIKNVPVSKGQKLAAVSLYYRNTEDKYATAWADFDPKVANCFTDDTEACSYLVSTLTARSWQCLKEALLQVPDKDKTGLYHVVLDKKLVNNAY